jgi:hypothetical protein
MGRPKLSEQSAVISIRLPVDLIRLLDQYAETLRSQTPGLNITRTDAARAILTSSLVDKNQRHGAFGGKA